MTDALAPIVMSSVTPIGLYMDGDVLQHATGTFFQVANRRFLVTAGHIWHHEGKELALCAFVPGKREGAGTRMRDVPLSGKLSRALEPADVAVLELSDETVRQLEGRRFLRLHEVEMGPTRRGWCYVFGFPTELVKPDPASSGRLFGPIAVGANITDTNEALDNYSREGHFLIDVCREDLYKTDGTPTDLPRSLAGMSGGSVWQTLRPGEPIGEDWRPESIRIVGVQVGYYRKNSLIKCVAWGVVAKVIYDRYPDLRPVLDMYVNRLRVARP